MESSSIGVVATNGWGEEKERGSKTGMGASLYWRSGGPAR